MRRSLWFFLLLVPQLAHAQVMDTEQMEELQKKMEAINEKIAACGSDVSCLERVGREAQSLIQNMGMVPATPGNNVRELTVTVRNKVEYRFIDHFDPRASMCKGGSAKNYDVQNYVFEYQTIEKGELRFADDWSRFHVQSPVQGNFAFDKPNQWKIIQASGFRQRVAGGGGERCWIQKLPDGAFKEISSGNKTTGVQIVHPTTPGAGNLSFHPISITVRNADRSCPSCSESYYEPGVLDSGQVVTPVEMKKALDQGRFERTATWRVPLDDPRTPRGSYQQNTVTITIEIQKAPGKLSVTPADAFKTHGDEKGNLHPKSKTYTLKNTGESPIQFAVANGQAWLTPSTTSGTLAPGKSANVTVAVSKKLEPGTHKDQVKLTNTTNGSGNTARDVVVEIGEYQVWDVKLTGKETDDMGGALMYAKVNDAWQYVTFDYGVRFNYIMTARIVLKKVKGKWTYNSGTITSAKVTPVPNFDPNVFSVTLPVKCHNCQDVPKMTGKSLGGSVDGKATAVELIWPSVVTNVTVRNQLKLKHSSLQKSHQGYSENFFHSSEFFHRAHDHSVPLKNDHYTKKVPKSSHKDRSRLDKRQQISLYYSYYLQRVH